METIKQNREVNFNAIDVKDIINMLPLMDELKRTINYEQADKIKNNLPKEEQKRYTYIYYDAFYLDLNTKINVYKLLSKLGFVSTINETPEDILNEHEIK